MWSGPSTGVEVPGNHAQMVPRWGRSEGREFRVSRLGLRLDGALVL
jgi:hypothetical protein